MSGFMDMSEIMEDSGRKDREFNKLNSNSNSNNKEEKSVND